MMLSHAWLFTWPTRDQHMAQRRRYSDLRHHMIDNGHVRAINRYNNVIISLTSLRDFPHAKVRALWCELDMGEPPVPRSTDEARATMDGCAVLQGSYLVNCNFHQIIQNCPHADSSLLPTERIARSDHSATEFSEAEDTTRQQQTRYVTPQNPTGNYCIHSSASPI